MKKLFILAVACAAQGAYARGECKVERGSNGYYTVTRDGVRISGSYSTMGAALSERDNLQRNRVCRVARASDSSCDVTRQSNGYYVATVDGNIASGSYSTMNGAISARNELLNARACVLRNNLNSDCDISRLTNGYFVAVRGNTIQSGSYSTANGAISARNDLVNARACELKDAYRSGCDITRLSNGYYVVVRDGKTLSGSYSTSGGAISARDSLIRSEACVLEGRQRRGGGHYRDDRPIPRAVPVENNVREVLRERLNEGGLWIPKPQDHAH